MGVLRDPIWQFLGVVAAVVMALVPLLLQRIRRRRSGAGSRVAAARQGGVAVARDSGPGKHKKRKADGILFANVSSDFLNQFPIAVRVLAAHLDRLYTPENFGGSNWLLVFCRLAAEGYFQPADGKSPKRLKLDSFVNPGPRLESWLRDSARAKRSIAGWDDEETRKPED